MSQIEKSLKEQLPNNTNNNKEDDDNSSDNNSLRLDDDNKNNENLNNDQNNDLYISPEDLQKGSQPLPDSLNIKFINLCKLFDKISTIKPKDKVNYIKKFVQYFFSEAIKNKISLFQFFRLIFPKYDNLRASYGIAEVFISKLYENILGLPEKEQLMLKHWKNPNYLPQGAPVGSYISLIKYIISNRVTNKSQITINELNNYLTMLNKTKDKNERINIMTQIIKYCTAEEQKWIVGIILKDMKIGLSHEIFFKLYENRSLEIFNSTSNLVTVCDFLADPKNPKFAETTYQPFCPIRPMLAARMTLDNIYQNFENEKVLIETKWDGERIQCHYIQENNMIKFYTRKGVDYSSLYGKKFNDIIKNNVKAKGVILDGEMVVYDKKNEKFSPFGDNKTIAKIENDNEKCLVYEIFDIVYYKSLNGQIYNLNKVILSDRKKILQQIITPINKKLELVLGTEVYGILKILDQFNIALKNAEEGILIKKLNSLYQPDKRCPDWVKMKCDYIDTIVDTLDLIIIGGYYGEGRRIGEKTDNSYIDTINSFLLGIIKKIDKNNPKTSTILPLAKVGTGYSIKELNDLRLKLKPLWKKYDSKIPPTLFGQWTPGINDRPDVYIENPSLSIILEIKAAEIINSDSFPTKVTLRFARVVNVRYDKSWVDALKYDDLLNLYNISVNNLKNNNALFKNEFKGVDDLLQHKHIIKKNKLKNIQNMLSGENDVDEDLLLLAKKTKNINNLNNFLPNFRDTDTSNAKKISNIFSGCQFLVLQLDENENQNILMKQTIEYMIVENGGEKVQNYLASVTHIIANKTDFRAKNILKIKDYNLIKSKWIEDCVKYKKLIKISPKYLTYANRDIKDLFAKTIDRYGDSYFEEIDINELEGLFENILIKDVDKEFDKCLILLMEEYENNEDFKNIIDKQ